MPEILELEPLKKKTLKLIMVESEFPIEWWFEASVKEKHDLVWNMHLISKEYLNLVESLINKYKPDFAVEEKGSRWGDTISHDDPLEALFRGHLIPYKMVDISENAEDYLSSNLDEHRSLISNLATITENYIKLNGKILPRDDLEFQQLILWKEYLQQEYKTQEDHIRYSVREAWMIMGILKLAKTIQEKKDSK